MESKTFKKLPYGTSNFERLINDNYAYVDKTRFIEMLENEPNQYQFFIRPRKFGKSLFLSILANYYDIQKSDSFERLFGDLYIGKHPTPRKNSYAVIEFDFSGIDTSEEDEFKISFSERIRETVLAFLADYTNHLPEAKALIQKINKEKPGVNALSMLYGIPELKKTKLFVIIDEYDHFANDLIAMGSQQGDDVYRRMVRANGLVRDFYELLKTGTKKAIDRIFITGISPVMLDDLTSGFNIANNLTTLVQYNEMLGFTQAEVDKLMVETGVDPAAIVIDMSLYYNGYLFHPDGDNRLYNSSMVLYFFERILSDKKMPRNIVDLNLKTDYGRLKRLIQNEKSREILLQIIKDGSIVAKIIEKFSIDRLFDENYFISLLFYMGLLTIKEPYLNETRLCIPNYSIETVYWEYILQLMQESSPLMNIETRPLNDAIYAMALEGDVRRYIDYVSKNVFSRISDKDLKNFDEKYIKLMLLSLLFQSETYIVMSEYETGNGYTDIFLQRNHNLPQVKYEWVLEIKYLKTKNAKGLQKAQKEASEQLQRYIKAYRLEGRPGLKTAIVVFTGKNDYQITEK
jgi:hypothetical protein